MARRPRRSRSASIPRASRRHPRPARSSSGGKDGKVRLLDREGKRLTVVEAQPDAVVRVAWSADGAAFATFGRQRSVYRFAADGTAKTLIDNHAGSDALTFQPGTGKVVVDSGASDVIRILGPDRTSKDLVRWSDRIGFRHDAHVHPSHLALGFGRDGQTIAFATCGGETGIHDFAAAFGVVDVETDKATFLEPPDGSAMYCAKALVWTRDGRRIVRMDDHHAIRFYDFAARKAGPSIGSPSLELYEARQEARRAKLEVEVTASAGVSLLPARDDACEVDRTKLAPDARGFACDRINARAFAGDAFGAVHVFDLRTRSKQATFMPMPAASIRSGRPHVALAPDGKLVASWSEDGTLVVNEASPPFGKRLERRGVAVVTRLGWTADGRHVGIFSGGALSLVRIADGVRVHVEEGMAWEEGGAFEDLDAPVPPRGRDGFRVRIGDLANGDLVPLARAAAATRPGLLRRFLAGEPLEPLQLAICGEPWRAIGARP